MEDAAAPSIGRPKSDRPTRGRSRDPPERTSTRASGVGREMTIGGLDVTPEDIRQLAERNAECTVFGQTFRRTATLREPTEAPTTGVPTDAAPTEEAGRQLPLEPSGSIGTAAAQPAEAHVEEPTEAYSTVRAASSFMQQLG
jgi:hypothetical protein